MNTLPLYVAGDPVVDRIRPGPTRVVGWHEPLFTVAVFAYLAAATAGFVQVARSRVSVVTLYNFWPAVRRPRHAYGAYGRALVGLGCRYRFGPSPAGRP